MALCGAATWAATPGTDAVTERIREILRKDGGDSEWGADPPAKEIATRGEPFAATTLTGAGHAMVMIDSEGRPRGSHLVFMHVSVEGARVARRVESAGRLKQACVFARSLLFRYACEDQRAPPKSS